MRTYALAAAVAVIATFAACSNGGTLSATCNSGQSSCNGECVDTQTDVNNCGACGTVCPAGESCAVGTCAVTCPAGSALCASGELSASGASINICVDERSDNLNCGSCGTKCTNGTSCVDAGCASPLTEPTLCSLGLTTCELPDSGIVCTNTAVDAFNCGGCGQPDGGHVCPGGQLCLDSICTPTCVQSESVCEGQCVNTQTDSSNCGGCADGGLGAAAICSPGEVCSGGHCTATCSAPFATCTGLRPYISDSGYNPDAGDPDAGYCADVENDPLNCGACHNACADGVACTLGVCQLLCPSTGQSCTTPTLLTDGGTYIGNTCCGSNLSFNDAGCVPNPATPMVAYQLPPSSGGYFLSLTAGFAGTYTPGFCFGQSDVESYTCTGTSSSYPNLGGNNYLAVGQLDGGCGEFTLFVSPTNGI